MRSNGRTKMAAATLMAMTAGLAAATAYGDKLIMEDGNVIMGAVSRTSSEYTVVQTNGTQFTFDKSDVKRAEYITRVSAEDAADMLAEFRELVMPVLDVQEPSPFISITDEQQFGATSTFDAASASVDVNRGFARDGRRRSFAFNRNRSASAFSAQSTFDSFATNSSRRDKATDDVFVDDWVRYTAIFEALGNDPRYRDLTNRRRHADSLGDFAFRAPDEHDALADAVRDALNAVDDCLDLAASTQKRVQALPLRALEHAEDIRELEDDLARERDRLRTAYDYYDQLRDVRRAEDRLRRRITKAETETERAQRVAERKINEFARAREIARQQIEAAEQQLIAATNAATGNAMP
ncbi:MAG: hypothetical protein H6817_07360 [Phycisphaerales bacterium]|nr:hypothetical protein [Phycisphaerales bacterium]